MEEELQFTLSRIDELMYRVDFDPVKKEGKIIVNIFSIHAKDMDNVLDIFQQVIGAGLCVSPLVKLFEGKDLGFGADKVCIGNACSITIDSVLLKSGVPVNPRFGGVVEVIRGQPTRFVDMVMYEGTTIDPLEVLMSQDLTSISTMMRTGSGKILANLREVPMVARDRLEETLDKLSTAGFSGILEVGEPNTELLSVDVGRDHIGVAVLGGTNPAAAAIEQGYELRTHAMSLLVDYSELVHVDTL